MKKKNYKCFPFQFHTIDHSIKNFSTLIENVIFHGKNYQEISVQEFFFFQSILA